MVHMRHVMLWDSIKEGLYFFLHRQLRNPLQRKALRAEVSSKHHTHDHAAGRAIAAGHDRLNEGFPKVVFIFCDEVYHPRKCFFRSSGLSKVQYNRHALFVLGLKSLRHPLRQGAIGKSFLSNLRQGLDR